MSLLAELETGRAASTIGFRTSRLILADLMKKKVTLKIHCMIHAIVTGLGGGQKGGEARKQLFCLFLSVFFPRVRFELPLQHTLRHHTRT